MLYDFVIRKISDRKGWNDRMATIGQQIRAARKAKGMTQSALAALVNMSRQGVSHWEQGRTLPDAQMLLQLSRILGYNFEANMTHEEPQERSETGCQFCFTLSASHEGTFPFYPEQLVAQLHYRLPQDEGIPPQPAAPLAPDSAEEVAPGSLQVLFSTSDPAIAAVDCVLKGRNKAGSLLACRTAASLILEKGGEHPSRASHGHERGRNKKK